MFQDMDSLHLDVLKEVSSIGTGNAINSLSQITNKKIHMEVPTVTFLQFKEVSNSIGPPEDIIVGIMVTTEGDINGMVMFLLNIPSARTILNYFYEIPKQENEEFNDLDIDSLKEVGNILISSYISALGTLINKRIRPSVPQVAVEMSAAILSVPAIKFAEISDGALHIETVFTSGEDKVSGFFLLVPDAESFNVIMRSLGVM